MLKKNGSRFSKKSVIRKLLEEGAARSNQDASIQPLMQTDIGRRLKKGIADKEASKKSLLDKIQNLDIIKQDISFDYKDMVNNDECLGQDEEKIGLVCELLEGISDPSHPNIQNLLFAVKDKIGGLLYENELGQLTDKKSAQIAAMVAKGAGNVAPYNRGQGGRWSDPLDYLEDIFGAYLARYNSEKRDFMYLTDLEKIVPNFRNTLRAFVLGRGEELSDYVAYKADKMKREVGLLESVDSRSIKIFNKINSLKQRKGGEE